MDRLGGAKVGRGVGTGVSSSAGGTDGCACSSELSCSCTLSPGTVDVDRLGARRERSPRFIIELRAFFTYGDGA